MTSFARAGAFTLALALALPAALSAAEPTLYIPLGSAGEVLAVDAESGRVAGTVAETSDAHGLAIAPDGRTLIAASYAESPRAGAPPRPQGVSADDHAAHHARPAAREAAAGEAVSYLSVIDRAAGRVTRRIEVPGAVHHVAVTPEGRYAIATHPGRDGISVVDLEAARALRFVKTGPLPNYAAASPDGARIYVSNAGNDTLSEIDTGRWIVRRDILVGASPEHVVMSADGTRLYVANVGDGTVSEVALPAGDVARGFDIGGALHGLDLADDGRALFVSALERDEIAAVDLVTGAVRRAPLAPAPYHLTNVPGASILYVSSAEEPKVWAVDAASLEVRAEIPIRGEGHQMVVLER